MNNLRSEMERCGISVPELAGLLGHSEKNIRDKIAEVVDFSYLEAGKIRVTFFPTLSMEYLFASDDGNKGIA
jgi:hypothetical protein